MYLIPILNKITVDSFNEYDKTNHIINAVKYPSPIQTPPDSDEDIAEIVQVEIPPLLPPPVSKADSDYVTSAVSEFEDYDPGEVFVAASRIRWYDGQIAFDVKFHSDRQIFRVPLNKFMDISDQTFTNKVISDTVNHWIAVAKEWPAIRRNCLCCNTRAIKGKVLCRKCTPEYGPTIYA